MSGGTLAATFLLLGREKTDVRDATPETDRRKFFQQKVHQTTVSIPTKCLKPLLASPPLLVSKKAA